MSDPLPQWLKITITEYALDDLKSLANIELKNIAIEMISKLASRELRGLRLWSNSKTGDLTGCNKVYFDVSRDISPGYRIVYPNIPSDNNPEETSACDPNTHMKFPQGVMQIGMKFGLNA